MAEASEAPSVSQEITDTQRVRLQELSSAVVLGEARGGVAALPAMDRLRFERARASLQKGDFNKSLENMADIAESPNELGEKIRSKVEKFGTTVNAATGLRDRPVGSPEETRFNDATEYLNAAVDFMENGWDNMEPGSRNTVRVALENALRRMPNMAQEFNGLTPAQQTDFVIEKLRDPNYAKFVKDGLITLSKRTLASQADIHKARKESARTTEETEVAIDERDHTQADAYAAQQALNTIRNPVLGAPLPPRLQAIERERTRITTTLNNIDWQENALRIRHANLTNAYGPNPSRPEQRDLLAIDNQINTVQASRRNYQTQLGELLTREESLAPNEANAEARVDERRARFKEARLDAAGLPEEQLEKMAAVDELERERIQDEELLTRGLENLFTTALQRNIASDLQASITALEANEHVLRTENARHAWEGVKTAMDNRWIRQSPRNTGIFRRKGREYVQDQRTVDRDYNQLLRSGPELQMRGILGSLRPTPGGLEAPLTQEQISQFLNDPQFADQLKDAYINQVVSRRIAVKKIRPGEVHLIMNSSWGKDKIDHALATDANYQAKVRELTGSNDIDKDSREFKSRFSRAAWRHPALLLFPLTTGPTLLAALIRANWETNKDDARRDLAEQMAA